MLDFSSVAKVFPFLLQATAVTLELSALAIIIGLILGLIAALMKLSNYKVLRWLASFYIWITRGTPLIAQLLLIYFGLPKFGIEIGAFESAVIGLGINAGAFIAEIFRGGILSIPKGQTEAAESLGMSYFKILRRIILPQALRISVPALGNQAISMLKDTSLASIVTVSELMMTSQQFAAGNFAFIEFYITASAIYLALTSILYIVLRKLEHRLSVSDQ
jgi:polar amino acid transport system permease protein